MVETDTVWSTPAVSASRQNRNTTGEVRYQRSQSASSERKGAQGEKVTKLGCTKAYKKFKGGEFLIVPASLFSWQRSPTSLPVRQGPKGTYEPTEIALGR
jgi:hypothetical protein